MVKGLDIFAEYFQEYQDSYVLIGGTAAAILMDDNYYSFLVQGKTLVENISVLRTEYIIPFKTKAWIDLSKRREQGASVDRKNIKKHKNDVFRLAQIVEDKPDLIPEPITADMELFLDVMKQDPPDVASLGITGITAKDILTRLEELYSR